MAFPSIATTAFTDGTVATANAAVNLPTGIAAGDLLIVVHRSADGTAAHGYPAGWTVVFQSTADASNDRTSWAWRKADGTEGATITVTQTSSKFASLAWRITGAEDPTVQAPESGTVATGTSNAPNPGATTPTGGAKDYLWLAIAATEGEPTSVTYPTNYTLNQFDASSGTGGAVATNCNEAGAGRQLNAATEDPGTFSVPPSDDWTAWTIAVHPAGAPPPAGQPTYSRYRGIPGSAARPNRL